MKRLFSKRGLGIMSAIALIVFASVALRREDGLEQALMWIESKEAGVSLLLFSLYLPAAIVFIPPFLISLVVGYMLGFFPGVIIISIGNTIGAVVAFYFGRFVARKFVEDKLRGHRKFQALDHAVGRQGFRVVFLTRVAPFLSYNVLNYMYGLTQVSARDYILGTWLGMIPASIVLAFLGASAKGVPEILANPTLGVMRHPYWLGAGLIATIAIVVVLFRRINQAFRRFELNLPDADESGVDIILD